MKALISCKFWQQRRILFLVAICFLLNATTSSGQNQIECCCDKRDLVFIIDQSGSMLNNDRDSWRWGILNYALRYLNKTAENADRVAIIPFGGNRETINYANQSRPGGGRTSWFNLADETDVQSLQTTIRQWYDRKEMRDHSLTTNILSAFEYFERNIDQQNSGRDLFVFFISDGRVDLYSPNRKVEPEAIEQHNEQLLNLLEKHSNRWRLYNICLGNPKRADVSLHRKMVEKISITTRFSGRTYPGFVESEPDYPFLLLAKDDDSDANLEKMKRNVRHVLARGSSIVATGKMENDIMNVPGLGSAALQLSFTVRPVNRINAQEFAEYLTVNYVIDGIPRTTEVDLLHPDADNLARSSFDFIVVEDSLLKGLEKIKRRIDDIERWQIAVQPPGSRIEITNLEVSYEHGWNLIIETLRAISIPKENRNLFNWILDKPESFKTVLKVHAFAENQCGRPLSDSTASLEIVSVHGDTLKEILNIVKLSNGENGKGEKYELWAEISNDRFLLKKLGEKIRVKVSFPAHQYIFQTNTVSVRVCAEYSDLY